MKGRSLPIRLGTLFLALLMLVTIVPLNVFAEVEPANWTDDEETARYWPIPHQGRLVKVSTAEPVKNPSLRFIGGYTRPDGREVVRLAFSGYSGSVSAVWERLLIKPDNNLNEMIDWSESVMGKKRPEQAVNNHDAFNFNKDWVKFQSLSSQQGGSGNLHVMDLGDKGTHTVKTGLVGVHFETPIDLVLKKGESIRNLKTNPLIQMRLMDSSYERIYSTTIESNEEVPYSSYTMSTFVPVRENLSKGTLRTDVVRNYENIFQSASSYIKYNEEAGYIDVYTRRTHGNVEAKADNGGSFNSADEHNKGNYGFRQTFDASFIDILKPQDESGTVAQIFTADDNDNIVHPSADPNVPLPANRIDYSLDTIKKTGGVGVLEVSTNDPNKTFMPTGTGLTTYGDSTVVRYFIDKDKLKQSFGSTDIVAYEFFSTLFAQNETGVEEFKSTTRDQDINLKRGDKIHIRFDGRRELITLGTFDTRGSLIQIGDDQFSVGIRTTNDKAVYTGTGWYKNENYLKSMEVKVPFDIKIKKDTPLTIFSRKTKLQEVSPGMTVRFEYTDQDSSGNDIKKNVSYRFERPLVEGYTRNAQGDIFKDGEKINKPDDSLFIDNHQPLVISRQANFAGGILTRTADAPDIDEIFTDSENLTGRSKYERVNVYLYDADKQKVDTAHRIGTIKASDKKIEMNVNGDDVQGYEWTSAKNKEGEKLSPSIWAQKDTPLFFTNQDVLQNALENEKPVVEQVQAKVKFDLNGGTSPVDTISYQGVDTSKKVGTEGAYVLKRSTQTEAITRIAPMNEKFNNEAGYKHNGFEGEGIKLKDHNGNDLTGHALTLRKFPTEKEEPKATGKTFLGWTTKKLTGTPEDVTKAFNKLEEADTVDKVNHESINYIFTKTSPITKGMTVYAAYGSPLVKFHNNAGNVDPKFKDEVIRQSLMEKDITNKEVKLERNYSKDAFKLEGYSLIGYTRDKEKAKTPLTSIPDENITGSDADLSKDIYLRDGDALKLTADQLKNGLDLYALWRPNHHVDVTKVWGDEALKTKNQNQIKVGLLTRPAVGTQGQEVVHPDAVYRPVENSLKPLTDAVNGKLEWKNLPSYDENGHRMSYIAVEITPSMEETFSKGGIKYSEYGVSIIKPEGSKYATKIQLVNKDGVDAMSAATTRTQYKNGEAGPVDPHAVTFGYFDTLGYSIVLANKSVDVQPPAIEGVKHGQSSVVVHKNGDPSKLVVSLPDGSKATLVKNASGLLEKDPTNTSFTGDIVVEEDGKITLTLPNQGTFAKDQVIKAQQFKKVGEAETPSTEVSVTVQPNDSAKVVEFKQVENNPEGKPLVEFKVPNPPLNPPKAGSQYTIGYVDGDNFIPLADPIVLDKDLQSDSDTALNKTFVIDKAKLDPNKTLVIRAKEQDGQDTTGQPIYKTLVDSEPVILDITAPEAKAVAQDELWRRWVNVNLSDFVDDQETIVVKYTDLNGEQIRRFDKTSDAEATIDMLKREGFKGFKITVEDKFGNSREITPSYEASKVIQILIRNPRIGRNYVQVRGYEENTTVTVRIYNASDALDVENRVENYQQRAKATGTAPVDLGRYTKINLSNNYKLTKGDIMEVVGTTPDGGITNPHVVVLGK